MEKLLIQVSTTEIDFSIYKNSLIRSLKNVLERTELEVKILIIYQTNTTLVDLAELSFDTRVEHILTSAFGVSSARNVGLRYARNHKFDYIVFHDASIYLTPTFVNLINHTANLGLNISRASIYWGDFNDLPTKKASQSVDELVKKDINLILEPYIWAFVIRVSFLRDLHFNENVGPGQSTTIKAGEDLVFLCQLTSFKVSFPILYDKQAIVVHPQRLQDKSKHLAYAEPQGILLRWMLKNNLFNFHILSYSFMFIGNAIFGLIIRKPNSRKIFKNRISGFLDSSQKRQLLP